MLVMKQLFEIMLFFVFPLVLILVGFALISLLLMAFGWSVVQPIEYCLSISPYLMWPMALSAIAIATFIFRKDI